MKSEMNVGFVSLGCSKNLIDTEVMIGKFKNNEYNGYGMYITFDGKVKFGRWENNRIRGIKQNCGTEGYQQFGRSISFGWNIWKGMGTGAVMQK